MNWIWIVVIVILVLLILFIASTYNSLVGLRNKVKDQWAQIDVLLKRRTDLIPNLVETVKGYASHESETLESVVAARNKVVSAKTTEDEMKSNGELSLALGRLMAVSEAYPELKANANFIDLQNNLRETEDKIESIGIEKAKKILENSDIVLLVLDSSRDLTKQDKKI